MVVRLSALTDRQLVRAIRIPRVALGVSIPREIAEKKSDSAWDRRSLVTMGVEMDLAKLIQRFRGPLIAMLASFGASPRDAVELAQDVFAEAYLSRERFTGDWQDVSATGGWLRGIARNLFRAHLRKSSRESTESHELRLVEPSEPTGSASDHSHVRLAIARLRRSWRVVLTMHYLEGSTLAEIAALLGVSARSVEGRLRRARAELKRLLEGESVQAEHEKGDAR